MSEDAQVPVAAILAELPDECWVSRDVTIRCTDFIDGHFDNGARWTREMCCLPCRILAVLSESR